MATSVGEEGLDIPSADLVIFYEPVSSEIRTIQRRGRTGRSREARWSPRCGGYEDEGARRPQEERKKCHRAVRRVSRSLTGNPHKDLATYQVSVWILEGLFASEFALKARSN